MPEGYRLLWAGWYRLDDGAGPYAWDGSAFALIGSGGAAVGGAALLEGETNGFATDFTHATDSERVATKFSGVVTSYGLDSFFQNGGLAPKLVYNAAGALVWAPHNLYLNSGAPVTGAVTTIVGETYTLTVTGSGSIAVTVGGSGTATAASPLTFVATGTSCTVTKTGTVTQAQLNRGSTATAYLATAGAVRVGLCVDYDPATLVARGLSIDQLATNLLLNSSGALSTQSVTVTAAAHTLTFYGTGTITLSGVSTAGPLVGTGANNRVSLTFTPTAGSLTLTVTGSVTRAQLETGTFPTTPIPTWGVTQARAADNFTFLLSTIPALTTEYSVYIRYSTLSTASSRHVVALTDGTTSEFTGLRMNGTANLNILDGGAAVGSISQGTIVADTLMSTAFRVKLNDCAMSTNGAAAAFDTTVTLPTVTEVRFGGTGGNAAAVARFYITKLVIVPRAWSDAELQTRSAT